MKAILWLGVVGIATNGAFAQGARQTMRGGPAGDNLVQNGITQGSRPPAPMPPGFPGRPHPGRPFAPIYPLGFGGYDYGYAPQGLSVVVVEPPPPPYAPVPERPPEAATMVIHEYQPLSANAAQPSEGDQPLFAIVLKNSTILSASAVVVQDGALHIVDPDGGHQRVLIETVDRVATKRVNQERKLQLQLPPPAR